MSSVRRPTPDVPSPMQPQRSGAWFWYLVGGSLLIVAYFAMPPVAQDLVYDLVGLSAVAAIAVPLVPGRGRLVQPRPWLLIGLGQAAFVAADLTWDVYTYFLDVETPFPSVADVFYLAAYPFLACGVVALSRRSAPGRDRSDLLDAAVVSTSAAVLTWVYLVEPLAMEPEQSALARAISVSYPLMDLLLVLVVLQLTFVGGQRTASRRLLGTSLILTLTADVAYSASLLAGTYTDGSLIDGGWLLAYVLLGASALHPSADEAPALTPAQEPMLRPRRLLFLCMSAMVGLIVLAIESLRGRPTDGWVIAVGSGVLFLLVVARLVGLNRALVQVRDRLQQAVYRERVLKEAGARLMVASDRAAIEAAAVQTAMRLMPPRSGVEVIGAEEPRPDASGNPPLTISLSGPVETRSLVVHTTASLSADVEASLQTLASQVTTALDKAALVEDLARRVSLEERVRMARDIHDVVAHALSMIVMRAGSFRLRGGAHGSDAAALVGDIEQRGRHAMGELRRLLDVVRADGDDAPSKLGLESLPELLDGVRRAGVDVNFRVEGDISRLDPIIAVSAYRIVQEALTNVVKHAGASLVSVVVRGLDHAVELTVEDRGPSRDDAEPVVTARSGMKPGGFGLTGMRERASLLGGEVRAGPIAEGGYRVWCRLPLRPSTR